MPMYRVYIRKPTTIPPIWDWAETIVRKDQVTAVNDSYQNWVNRNPRAQIPPLGECETQVKTEFKAPK